jgi:hypothetical protein
VVPRHSISEGLLHGAPSQRRFDVPVDVEDVFGVVLRLDRPETLVSVFNRGIYETIAGSSPERGQKVLEVLDSTRATLYVYEGDVPHVLGIMDEVVYVGVENDMGVMVALIETTDQRVFDWAVDTFEDYRDEATLMARESFQQLRPTTA